MTTPTYEQQEPSEGKLLNEDNEVLDLQEFMESGVIIATAVSSATPVTPIGSATVPTYEQITPQAKKFINSLNEVYDFLAFLQSGNLKVQVTGAASPDASYITSNDETATLPNSYKLLGTSNQIAVTDGVLSLASDLILPGTINLNGHDIKSNSGQNIRIAPGDPALDWIDLQSKTVNILESIIFNGESTDNITFNHVSSTLYFNMNNVEVFSLSSTGVSLGADLLLKTHKITSSSGTPIQLVPDNDADGIDLSSTIVRIETDLQHAGESDNKISFTTGAQTNYIGGASIFDINSSGFRLGAGYRVSTISNDSTAYLDTQLMTAYAIQTAIGNAIVGSNNFRGGWDASGGTFPTTGGTGTSGAIAAGNSWRITVGGTLGGEPVDQGDQIIAGVANPGQTASNWIIVNPRVFSVFGRTGSVVAQSGDYTYNQVTGLPATATSGKLMRGTGSAWAETTATYPDTVATNDLLVGGATNVITPLSTEINSVLTTSEFGTLRWTALGIGQLLMGTLTSGPVAANIFLSTGLSGLIGPSGITISISSSVDSTNSKVNVTASTQTLANNITYYTTYAGLCVMTLPASADENSVIEVIAGSSGSTFKIAQNAGQQILYGAQNGSSVSTTAGVSGYLQSTGPNTVVMLKCITANTTWIVVNNVNSLTVA